MTYKQAYDKIIDAYFKDEIRPFHPEFCFCGTLCDNTRAWTCSLSIDILPYTLLEYGAMEKALFSGFPGTIWKRNGTVNTSEFDKIYKTISLNELLYPEAEEHIFNGMCAALDALKQIHIGRGENVEELPLLTKRNLQDDKKRVSELA